MQTKTIEMSQHHMKTHTLHHITSKNICGTQCKKHHTKAPSNTSKTHILKFDKRHKLVAIAYQTHQLYRWLKNDNLDKVLSIGFWKIPIIVDKQKTFLIQFRIGQCTSPHMETTFLVEKLTHVFAIH